MRSFFDDNKDRSDLGKSSVRGGLISIGARGVNVVTQIGSIIILGRLLAPEDFGLVAMYTAVTGFAPVFIDLGTRDAAVQKPRITPTEVSALFWLTLGIGITLALAVFLGRGLIASFYDEPRLAGIAMVSSVTFVLAALSAQHYALLRRAMLFQRLAVVEILAALFGAGMAVAMAFQGYGYWSLVFRPILVALVTAVGVWACCRWIPTLPRFTEGVREMIRFGLHVTGFTMADYVGRSADRVALGYTLGPRILGFYQNASVIYENCSQILTVPLHGVAVASLSKLRDAPEKLRAAWRKALSTLAFFAMPGFVLLAILGPDLIVFLLGEKWRPAGVILAVIAMKGVAHIVDRTQGWLHVSAGRADRWMRWGLISSAVQVAFLLAGLPFGVMGVAAAYSLSMYVLFLPALAYAGRPLGIDARMVLGAVGPQMVGSLLAAAVGFWLRFMVLETAPPMMRTGILLGVTLAVYGVVTVLFFRITEPIEVASKVLRDIVRDRWARKG